MNTSNDMKNDQKWGCFNYCVCFVDLLGQKEAYNGQNLLPIFKSDDEKQNFKNNFKESVGSIVKLQEDAEKMLLTSQKQRPDPKFLQDLTPEQQEIWEQASVTKLITQRWSDGLVFFTCLGDTEVKCPINAVYDIITLSGCLTFMGLATKRPIRGGIDIAWGVELRPEELYGPAVAKAYELESQYAKYPRIAVGHNVIDYLSSHINNQANDIFSNMNRELSQTCLDMLAQDVDGLGFVHYLGEVFKDVVTYQYHSDLYNEAHKYIINQLTEHRNSKNTKLAFRYSNLLLYFENHQPAKDRK